MKGTKIGIACLLLGLIVSATGARADENQTLATAKNAIVAVPDTSFVDSQFKAAMIDDLNAAAELFLMATEESERLTKNALYQDAPRAPSVPWSRAGSLWRRQHATLLDLASTDNMR